RALRVSVDGQASVKIVHGGELGLFRSSVTGAYMPRPANMATTFTTDTDEPICFCVSLPVDAGYTRCSGYSERDRVRRPQRQWRARRGRTRDLRRRHLQSAGCRNDGYL